MILHWPQLAMLIWLATEMGFMIAMHGMPKTGTHSWFISALLCALFAWILYSGGFWTGAAQ